MLTVDRKITADANERFLGYLVTIVESWKIILILPLLVGALTYVYLVSRPNVYRSDATLRLSKDEVIVLKSARVFGAEVKTVGDSGSRYTAVTLTALDSPDTYNVAVTSDSATRAAAILQGMINRLPDETKPSEDTLAKLERRLRVLKDAQVSLSAALEGMRNIYAQVGQSEATANSLSTSGDFGQSFAILISAITGKDQEVAVVEAAQQPTFIADDVILAPTVPVTPVARTVGPFATLAFVLTLAVLLIFVFLRAALQRSSDSPELAQIRRALPRWVKS